jgi:prepilin-type N-terminal cleavage/methylation domain-containing protein
MNKRRGYTLVELIMAVSLLVIVLVGGTAIFYRSFRSSGVSDIQTTVNNGLRALDESIEQVLRYGVVVRVASSFGSDSARTECLAASLDGVSGDTLVVKDVYGGVATYSLLDDGTVSSNSGEIISNPGIFVTNLRFTWTCRSGVNDKINLLIEASASAITGEGATGVLNKDINLLNSGIN